MAGINRVWWIRVQALGGNNQHGRYTIVSRVWWLGVQALGGNSQHSHYTVSTPRVWWIWVQVLGGNSQHGRYVLVCSIVQKSLVDTGTGTAGTCFLW